MEEPLNKDVSSRTDRKFSANHSSPTVLRLSTLGAEKRSVSVILPANKIHQEPQKHLNNLSEGSNAVYKVLSTVVIPQMYGEVCKESCRKKNTPENYYLQTMNPNCGFSVQYDAGTVTWSQHRCLTYRFHPWSWAKRRVTVVSLLASKLQLRCDV